MKTQVSQFWQALGSQLVSSVAMSEYFKFTQFIVFLFARCLLGEFFDDFRHCNVSPSEGKCLRRSVNSSTPALSVWKLPQVLQQQEKYKWTLSFYRHGPPFFKFENNTSGRARLWDTALKFLAEAFFMTSPDHLGGNTNPNPRLSDWKFTLGNHFSLQCDK